MELKLGVSLYLAASLLGLLIVPYGIEIIKKDKAVDL